MAQKLRERPAMVEAGRQAGRFFVVRVVCGTLNLWWYEQYLFTTTRRWDNKSGTERECLSSFCVCCVYGGWKKESCYAKVEVGKEKKDVQGRGNF